MKSARVKSLPTTGRPACGRQEGKEQINLWESVLICGKTLSDHCFLLNLNFTIFTSVIITSKTASILFFVLWTTISYSQKKKDYFVKSDTLEVTLTLVSSKAGFPESYTSTIFTPVCKSGECYPVTITLFWDLLGNYKSYEMPEGEILTKNDHAPFKKEDYEKFGQILANRNSILEDFDIDEMKYTIDESVNSVDGITGATPKSILASVVEGAVYTCYTVWHIAQESFREQMLRITKESLTDDFLNEMLTSDNFEYHRLAIEKFIENQNYTPVLQYYQATENTFMHTFIIDELPSNALENEDVQSSLWERYFYLSYRNRMKLAEKYYGITVIEEISDIIEKAQSVENKDQMKRLILIYRNSKKPLNRKEHWLSEKGYN